MLQGSLELVPEKEKYQFGKETNTFSSGCKYQKGREKMVEGEDGSRTVDCLRGRLLAERVASKAANEKAELMARRVIELEMQLKIETQSRKRAEKKLKLATKKLNSLNLSGQLGSAENASVGSSDPQEPEEQKPNHQTEETNLDPTVSETLCLHNSTILIADSIPEEPGNGEESLHSRETNNSHNHENSSQERDGSQTSIDLGELNTKNSRFIRDRLPCILCIIRQSSVGQTKVRRQERIEYTENRLSLVPTRIWPESKICMTRLDDSIHHDVLVALKHAKEQLKSSIGRREVVFFQPFQLYGM